MSDTSRSMKQQGATWARGRDLDDIRRAPSLHSSNGSIVLQQGPTGTDLVLPDLPDFCTVSYDATAETYTVAMAFWIQHYDAIEYCKEEYVFPIPALEADRTLIRFWYQPQILHNARTVAALTDPWVLSYEKVAGGITVTDAKTAAAVKTCSLYATDYAVGDVLLYEAASYWLSRPMRSVWDGDYYSGKAATFAAAVADTRYNSPRMMPLLPSNCAQQTNFSYRESDPGILRWSSVAKMVKSGTYHTATDITVNVPTSTTADIYIGNTNGLAPAALYLADPASATVWSEQVGSITTDSTGRLTSLSIDNWTMNLINTPPRCGYTNASHTVAEGDVLHIKNGLITSIT